MNLMVLADATIGVSICPSERLGAFVVAFDVAGDFPGQIRFGSKDAPGNQIALNIREPDFDLIEPGGVSRGIMELNLGVSSEELSDGLGFVRRKVVDDHVNLFARRLRGDHICQKRYELGTGMALGGL